MLITGRKELEKARKITASIPVEGEQHLSRGTYPIPLYPEGLAQSPEHVGVAGNVNNMKTHYNFDYGK